MITISPHARRAMARHSVEEDEVRAALAEKPRFEVLAGNERRYVNMLVEKTRKIAVVWAYDTAGNPRVVTCYPLRRKP